MSNSKQLARAAAVRFRLPFSATDGFTEGSPVITIRPDEIPAPNGFAVYVKRNWRSFEAWLAFDSFAGNLLTAMANAGQQKRNTFSALLRLMQEKGIKVDLRINENSVEPEVELPEAPWRQFELSATRLSAAFAESEKAGETELTEMALMFLNVVLSLLPIDEANESPMFEAGLPEGARSRVEVNRYERNPINRAACIAAHGVRCKACGLDFMSFYGSLGDGYIMVHHVTPVSLMGGSYVIDPIHDLIPLCPNCHAMVHRQNPPLTVEELRSMITERRLNGYLEL